MVYFQVVRDKFLGGNMAAIKLFSPDGASGMANWYHLKENLKVPYRYTDIYDKPRESNIKVVELDFVYGSD